MLWIQTVAVATALVGNVIAKEMVPNDLLGAELYDSGVMMERIMMQKEVCALLRIRYFRGSMLIVKQTKWDQLRAAGRFASEQYPAIDNVVKCVNGLAVAIPGNANYTFRCSNVSVLALFQDIII